MTGIKVFSVKTGRSNYAIERITDISSRRRYRIMHDRRYVTPELFLTENLAIEALLEHLGRVFVRQMDLLANGLDTNHE